VTRIRTPRSTGSRACSRPARIVSTSRGGGGREGARSGGAALSLTLAAKEAYDFLGDPEGELALAQATLYLALAPKSNAVYVAFNEAKEDVSERPAEPVPLHIRNAPTRLMKELGYGAGYQYAHDAPDARVDQDDLPESLRGRQYYRPTDRGLEADLGRRLAEWRRWRSERQRPRV